MKSFLALTALVSTLTTVSGSGAVQLTSDNFKEKVKGKNAFIKFFAPWCGHCKAVKPDWDKLGDEFAASSSVLIGDVDCTADESQSLCEDFEVRGYPTIKYFVDGDMKGEDYREGRDFDTFKTFTEETLLIKCNVSSPDDCTEKEKGYIEKMKDKSSDDRKKQIERLEKMAGDSMKVELKQWLNQRLRILNSLEGEL